MLALTETKLKEKGNVSWGEVNGIISDVQEMERAREGVAVLDMLAQEFSGLNSGFQGL